MQDESAATLLLDHEQSHIYTSLSVKQVTFEFQAYAQPVILSTCASLKWLPGVFSVCVKWHTLPGPQYNCPPICLKSPSPGSGCSILAAIVPGSVSDLRALGTADRIALGPKKSTSDPRCSGKALKAAKSSDTYKCFTGKCL